MYIHTVSTEFVTMKACTQLCVCTYMYVRTVVCHILQAEGCVLLPYYHSSTAIQIRLNH